MSPPGMAWTGGFPVMVLLLRPQGPTPSQAATARTRAAQRARRDMRVTPSVALRLGRLGDEEARSRSYAAAGRDPARTPAPRAGSRLGRHRCVPWRAPDGAPRP